MDGLSLSEKVMIGTALLGGMSGVVGSFAVLRGRSLVGDMLAHAALPGVCLAFLLMGTRNLLGLSLGALATGLLGITAVTVIVRWTRTKEDAAIGIVLSTFFGAGVVLLSVIQKPSVGGNKAGLNLYIFGEPANMLTGDLFLLAGVAVVVLLTVAMLFKEFQLVCFDTDFAQSQGWPTLGLDLAMMAALAVVTVVGLPIVGVILIRALFPPIAPFDPETEATQGNIRNQAYIFHPGNGQVLTVPRKGQPRFSLVYPPADLIISRLGVDVQAHPVRTHLFTLATGFIMVIGVLIYFDWAHLKKLVARFGFLPLFAASVAQILYYKSFNSMAQKYWYWIQEMMLLVLILAVILAVLIKFATRKPLSKISRLPTPLLSFVSLLLIAFFTLNAYTQFRKPVTKLSHLYLQRAAWIRETFEPGTAIGTLGGGSLGYFLPEYTIVNIDGLISSNEYFQQLQAGQAAIYLLDSGIEYVIAREYLIEETNPYMFNFPDHLEFVSRSTGIAHNVVWRLVP
ncbi:MAG: metal ABC transporter permease [Planctomycetes bacterium]|nr:metal ABC transporter permease [Planctomycetota bacterium]